jgi:hypothetical protein
MKRSLTSLAALALLHACSVGTESFSVFYPPNSDYRVALIHALEAEGLVVRVTDEGGIAYAAEDAERFEATRARLRVEPRKSEAGLIVERPSRVEPYATLLNENGVEFRRDETPEGTRFTYSADDFELAARLYAELQAREYESRE